VNQAASHDAQSAPLVFLIAGEPSGDALGGRLMAALKTLADVRFAGIGGAHMRDQGLTSLFPMTELSVMGLAEVLPHVPRLLRRLNQTVGEIRGRRPAAVVTIDSPGFNFRVTRRLKGLRIPLIHYVAPSVWAWRPGRARRIAAWLDHLLALLPFEPPYFEAVGLPCTFVGHPVIESGADKGDAAAFRRNHGITAETPLVCLLPGSRRGEAKRLLPVFAETLTLLHAVRPSLRVVVPTTETVAGLVGENVRTWPLAPLLIHGESEKFDAFAAADAALAASGTVALELALARTPTVITYKVNPASAWLMRRIIRVRSVNLVNIILGRQAVPELLQEDCRADRLADAVERLLDDAQARDAQAAAAAEAVERLGSVGALPSSRAARVVLDLINDRPANETRGGGQ
jgi:lipid-A-disaccharide synthase